MPYIAARETGGKRGAAWRQIDIKHVGVLALQRCQLAQRFQKVVYFSGGVVMH